MAFVRNQSYGTAVGSTGGLTSLGSSSTWVAGYQWFIIDNTTEAAIDYFVEGVIRCGTTPTVNTEIRLYSAASYDGSTWRDTLTGAAGAVTLTSAGVRDSFMRLTSVGVVDATTSNRDYPFNFNLLSFYTTMPKKVTIFVAHNTGVNLNATGGQHIYNYSPIHETIV